MELANRYGINMGNILSAASSLKTARLMQDKAKMALDKEKAGISLRKNALSKKSNLQITKQTLPVEKTGTEFKPSNALVTAQDANQEQQQSTIFAKEEHQKNMALAPEVAKELEYAAKKEQEIEGMKKFFKRSGLSDNEANLRANGYSKRIDNFKDTLSKAEDSIKKEMIDMSAKQASFWFNIMETYKNNPDEANKRYKQKRGETIENISKLLRNGSPEAIKEADRLQEIHDNQPQDFTMDFAGVSLAEANQKLTTAETYQKQLDSAQKEKVAKTKYDRDISKIILGKNAKKKESVKTSQYQRDFTSREKQLNSILSGANMFNSPDKEKAILQATRQLKVSLEAFKRGDPQGYAIQFGENDPLSEMNLRKEEVKNNNSNIFPNDFFKLRNASQEKWKKFYISTGKKMPLKTKKGGLFSDDIVSIKEDKAKEDTRQSLPADGILFRDKQDNKVYKMINGKKVEMLKKGI